MFARITFPQLAAAIAVVPLALASTFASMPSAGASTTAPADQTVHMQPAAVPQDASTDFAGYQYVVPQGPVMKMFTLINPYSRWVDCAAHPNTYHQFTFGGSYGAGSGGWSEIVLIYCDSDGHYNIVIDYKWSYGPPAQKPFRITVEPGDTVQLSAIQKGSKMTLAAVNKTTGKSDRVTFQAPPTVSLETGYTTTDADGTTYPITPFGTDSATKVTVNKIPLAKLDPIPIDLVDDSGNTLVETSPLTKKGDGFSVTYVGP